MNTCAKFLALVLLLALKPACGGGGGGGGGVPGTGASFPALPMLVAPIPTAGGATGLTPVATPGATTINVTGKTDAVVQTELQNALTAGGNIVVTTGGGNRTVVLTSVLHMPSNQVTPKTVILDGSDQITLSGGLTTRILQMDDKAQITVQRMKFIDARSAQSGAAINSLARMRLATFINCSFDNCQTLEGGPDRGGGAIRVANGQHTQISGCTFNKCAGSNGGAVNSLGTQITIRNSTFTQNVAFGTGGGAEVLPIPGKGGIGGAVYVDNVSNDDSLVNQLEIAGCVFNANVANDHAGAVMAYTNPAEPSATIIDKCTFAGNVVVGGHGHSGAVYFQGGTATLTNSTFNLNSAASNAGAVFFTQNTSTITNCTFQGNTCGNLGGAIFAGGNITLLNVTLAQNVAGLFSGAMHSNAPTTIQNCVLSNNQAIGNDFAGDQTNESFSGGANVQSPAGGNGNKPASAAGTSMVANMMLGPLQNNTGPTFTMQPLAGSPAINLAGVAGAPATDQRGSGRNGAADAGACEGP